MEREYLHWLAAAPCISAGQRIALRKIASSAEEVYQMPEKEMFKRVSFTEAQKQHFLNHKMKWDIKREYENMQRKEVQLVTVLDKEYPDSLKAIPDPPFGLYIKGRLPSPDKPAAAIVGARLCSQYGRNTAGSFGSALAEAGIQVISGMAAGIDGEGQRGAVEAGGSSFGVLGCGPDICYPRENIELYMQLTQCGGLISEYPPGARPNPLYFPARNRIISGLSEKVIIIEAKIRSGSLITADLALEQGRDVYAVPGRINDVLSSGCNRLIKQGAGILLSPEDLLAEYEMDTKIKASFQIPLTAEEGLVCRALANGAVYIDEIADRTGIPPAELTGVLLNLQLKGLITENGKNNYCIKI